MKLKVEYLKTEALKPYAGNAKTHPAEQVEQIKKSIAEFGFNDPIAVWKDNEIIEGHGRLIAALELGLEEVPVIRLDGLTDEQRRAYGLAHNKLTMNTKFDIDLLAEEIKSLTEFDMTEFGFSDFEVGTFSGDFEPERFEDTEDEYPEKGLASFNVIITCAGEEEKEWLRGKLNEEGRLKRLYRAAELMVMQE